VYQPYIVFRDLPKVRRLQSAGQPLPTLHFLYITR